MTSVVGDMYRTSIIRVSNAGQSFNHDRAQLNSGSVSGSFRITSGDFLTMDNNADLERLGKMSINEKVFTKSSTEKFE